jgi:hypothetical protein
MSLKIHHKDCIFIDIQWTAEWYDKLCNIMYPKKARYSRSNLSYGRNLLWWFICIIDNNRSMWHHYSLLFIRIAKIKTWQDERILLFRKHILLFLLVGLSINLLRWDSKFQLGNKLKIRLVISSTLNCINQMIEKKW